jgi:hypothetical protein
MPSLPPARLDLTVVTRSRLSRAREVAADLLIATALVWSLPLLLGITVALLALLGRSF